MSCWAVPIFGPLSDVTATAIDKGALPAGLQTPVGITSDGTQLIIVDATGPEIWTISDLELPGNAVNRGTLPDKLAIPSGVAWDGTQLIIVDRDDNENMDFIQYCPTSKCQFARVVAVTDVQSVRDDQRWCSVGVGGFNQR